MPERPRNRVRMWTPPRVLVTSLVFMALAACMPARAHGLPPDDVVREILRFRVDSLRQAPGMVVGLVDPAGIRIVAYGLASRDDGRPVDGETLFEIGSVTKVLTGLLLVDAAERGELTLLDPVQRLLPDTVDFPSRTSGPVVLQDLALHRSGLPIHVVDRGERDDGSHETVSEDAFQAFLSRTFLIEGDAAYMYSELDFSVLGLALSHRCGLPYEELLRRRVTEVLGLPDTRFSLDPEQRARKATGHTLSGSRAPELPLDVHAPSMGAHSTAKDLTRLVSASLGGPNSSLFRALRVIQLDRADTVDGDERLGIGWHVSKRKGHVLVVHRGTTYGFSSFVGMDRETRSGVVVLANANTMIDDLGFHLLDERFEQVPGTDELERTEQDGLRKSRLKLFVGRLEIAPGQVAGLHWNGTGLSLRLPDAIPEALTPVADDWYVIRDAPVAVRLSATSRLLNEGLPFLRYGLETVATLPRGKPPTRTRVARDAEPSPLVEVAQFEDAGLRVTVTADGAALVIQSAGQAPLRFYPVDSGVYWSQDADAEAVFTEDGLSITQNDSTYTLTRVTGEASP